MSSQVNTYEHQLEEMNLLCFICRAGIKNVKCDNCNEYFCKNCKNNIDKCPFCRTDLKKKEDDTHDDTQEDGNMETEYI
jgi:hypothetical protein